MGADAVEDDEGKQRHRISPSHMMVSMGSEVQSSSPPPCNLSIAGRKHMHQGCTKKRYPPESSSFIAVRACSGMARNSVSCRLDWRLNGILVGVSSGVTIYRHDQGTLEVAPSFSLRTKDRAFPSSPPLFPPTLPNFPRSI